MERRILQEMADNELMKLAGQDDREAFEALALRYYREAIRAAERMVHDEMQAQDIVQDCFADLYAQRRRYHPSCSFRTYLYALVKHKSIDCLRKAGRREILLEEEESGWLSEWQSRDGSPEEVYFRRERIQKVAERIEQLPSAGPQRRGENHLNENDHYIAVSDGGKDSL